MTEYDLTVRWRAFPLHPHTPDDGISLEELFRTTPEKVRVMIARLKETADSLGLPFGNRSNTFNSRLAQELGKWAEERERGDHFHHAAFLAYFGAGLNLAKQQILRQICEDAGLPTDEAMQVIQKRSYRQQVDDDWQDAHKLAVTAVPTFIMPHGRLIGAQSYATLARFAAAGGVARKT